MTNVIELNIDRSTKDYTADRFAAKELVDRLHEYYHRRGFHTFKAWLEPIDCLSGRRFWGIRSNAVFRVPG